MSGACAVTSDPGAVRAVLGAVDCNMRDFAQHGYEAIAGGPAFQSALTVALTLYVALVGYRLLFAADGVRLADAPRMALKVGAVLALVSSWNLFETLVFDVAAKAPVEIAALISAGGAGPLDPIGRLQVDYDQLSTDASAFAAQALATAQNQSATTNTTQPSDEPDTARAEAAAREQAAAHALTNAAAAVVTVDTGLVAATTLAIGVLGAIGPIFVVLLLFHQTRGFFEGWVRALTAAGLASMSAWALILLMAKVLDPWLITLAQQRELKALDADTAMTAASIVFVFTSGQLAMVAASTAIALGFRLRAPWSAARPAEAPAAAGTTFRVTAPAAMVSRPALLADGLRRFDGLIEQRARAARVAPGPAGGRLIGEPWSPGPNVFAGGYRRPEFARDRLTRAEDRR